MFGHSHTLFFQMFCNILGQRFSVCGVLTVCDEIMEMGMGNRSCSHIYM